MIIMTCLSFYVATVCTQILTNIEVHIFAFINAHRALCGSIIEYIHI